MLLTTWNLLITRYRSQAPCHWAIRPVYWIMEKLVVRCFIYCSVLRASKCHPSMCKKLAMTRAGPTHLAHLHHFDQRPPQAATNSLVQPHTWHYAVHNASRVFVVCVRERFWSLCNLRTANSESQQPKRAAISLAELVDNVSHQ